MIFEDDPIEYSWFFKMIQLNIHDFLRWSNQIHMIFAHDPIEYTWFLNRCIWLIDKRLAGQCGCGSNGKEEVFHTSEIFRIGASLSDMI